MRRFAVPCLSLVLLFLASLATAQTTGDVTGRVTDEQGGALPGVTVEARGPAFQGVRTSVTDASGAYRLVLLPPGTYKVTAGLQGFAKIESTVIVSLGKTSTYDLKLRPTATAEVVVSGEAPLIDSTSQTIGGNIDSRQIKSLPTGRDYTSVVQIAPGISTQTANTAAFANTIVVNGSTGLENGFVIDGVNTTGVEYGQQGKDLNYEFIQEVEVKTGGYQAEFGGSTGGIVNVITKSGGNEFHGEGFVYYSNNSVQASNKHPRTRSSSPSFPATTASTTASTWAASRSRTSCGSSARTTGSRTRPSRRSRAGPMPAGPRTRTATRRSAPRS
jgi:hypothetical protein